MSHPPKEFCQRCLRGGHNYIFCNYLEDVNGIRIKDKKIEVLEVYQNKFFMISNTNEKCDKCGKRKHINPNCKKSIFIYQDDMD